MAKLIKSQRYKICLFKYTGCVFITIEYHYCQNNLAITAGILTNDMNLSVHFSLPTWLTEALAYGKQNYEVPHNFHNFQNIWTKSNKIDKDARNRPKSTKRWKQDIRPIYNNSTITLHVLFITIAIINET